MRSLPYTAKELAKRASHIEIQDYGFANREELKNSLQLHMIPLREVGCFPIELVMKGGLCTNGKSDKEQLYQTLILRNVNRNIQRVYKVKQANRNAIVRQVKALMSTPDESCVLRLDIHHFYESIDLRELTRKIIDEGRIDAQTIQYLNKIHEEAEKLGVHGLPKGVSVSAILSELLMKTFDHEVEQLEGVFYYARFVDDMVFFCNSEKQADEVLRVVKKKLKSLDLFLNNTKTIKWESGPDKHLEYLGYSFRKRDSKSGVVVSIAPRKINKIKTRITRSFLAYTRERNFKLLHKRVRYLTGNFCVHTTNSSIPHSVGLYYNYIYINDFDVLQELQTYYRKILQCRKGKLGSVLARSISDSQREILEKYSFQEGFMKKLHHHFTRSEISQITQIW